MASQIDEISVGPYRGWVAASYHDAAFLDALKTLRQRLSEPTCAFVSGGSRGGVARCTLTCEGETLDLAIKSYDTRNPVQDKADQASGSRAARSARVAVAMREAGVGTPEPVAALDRWEGGRLEESYYVSRYLAAPSFKDELIRLYRQDPDCSKVMALEQRVALAVRGMHEVGIVHGDMGNQNILVQTDDAGEWGDVAFIDLNRARVRDSVCMRERAYDISRVALPSDFLRVFIEMYFAAPPDAGFLRWQALYRRLFDWHTRTRRWRHPVRETRPSTHSPRPDYPAPHDIWIWDERSGQPVGPLRSRDRRRHYPKLDIMRQGGSLLRAAYPVARNYRALLREAFSRPVEMAGRIGVAVNPASDRIEREQALLEKLGMPPVLMRFYRHETATDWDAATGWLDRLTSSGTPVSVAAVQDRAAVKDSELWAEFADAVLSRVAGKAQWIEVGHAINRSKWGLWSLDEYRRMVETFRDAAERYPGVALTGAAAIDFEYGRMVAALGSLPELPRFAALSHHLYVDRRGAPENTQCGFDALGKFALARAIARWSPHCEDRLIISEVNWPIEGAGVYSPVGAPYESPGPRSNDPCVSETICGFYMIRYLLTALCSGLVDAVYWWQLVARGYGLVDDTSPDAWRERPAFNMLRFFLATVGAGRYTARAVPAPGASVFFFTNPDDSRVAVGYSHPGRARWEVPYEDASVFDACGNRIELTGRQIELSGEPVYAIQPASSS